MYLRLLSLLHLFFISVRNILKLNQEFSRQCETKDEARRAGTVPTLARLDTLRSKLNADLAAAKEQNTKEYEGNMKTLHAHYQNMMKQTQENGVALPATTANTTNNTTSTPTTVADNSTPAATAEESS